MTINTLCLDFYLRAFTKFGGFAMKAYAVLEAEKREVGKKSAIKELVRNKKVPGVIYLADGKSACVSMLFGDMVKISNDPSGMARLYEIKLEGKSHFCVLKEMQFNQVVNTPRAFDFKEVKAGEFVKVRIPIRILNKEICPGVKSGGDIYRLLYNVDLKCKAESIPYAIEIDVKSCGMGTKFFLSDIQLPEGCKMINNPILIRIAGKRVIKETEEQTTAEGETADATATATADATAGQTATAEAKK